MDCAGDGPRKQPLLSQVVVLSSSSPSTSPASPSKKPRPPVLRHRFRAVLGSVSSRGAAGTGAQEARSANMVSTALRSAVCLLLGVVLVLLTVEQKFTFVLTGSVMSEKHGSNKANKQDEAVHHNLDLIRERPRNLRLIFLGDSITRYQYLSLTYFLRHGKWFDFNVKDQNNLVHAHSFHHPLHPSEDWNEFFLQSNRMLYPMEVCDCLRSWDGGTLLERRYFYDRSRNNMVVYINMNGNERDSGRGYYGRINPKAIFSQSFDKLVGLPFGMNVESTGINTTLSKAVQNWKYSSWGDVIRHHVGNLNLDYDVNANKALRRSQTPGFQAHMILNAGLHPHDFMDPVAEDDIRYALKAIGLPGTWKTTTFSKEGVSEYQATGVEPELRFSDIQMCTVLGSCFDVSWTADLRPELYYDNLHFSEPVYRIFNEDFLEQLGLLPAHYQKFNRTKVLRKKRR